MQQKYIKGIKASMQKTITDRDVRLFAEITGDTNPLHLNDEYAKQTRFKKRIAHGILVAGLVSAVLGTKLPGPGTILVSQKINFTYPVEIGDTITAEVELIQKKKSIIKFKTTCMNQKGIRVLDGEAVILV
jgi:3-hydroxybutyryl-CoA dehydratase